MGDSAQPGCPRCLEVEEELRTLRQRLADAGRYVAYSPGPNPHPDVERELRRWLAVHPRADAAAGFRAGWARLARLVGPRLRDWEDRWWRAMRDNDSLRSRLGVLLPVSWNTRVPSQSVAWIWRGSNQIVRSSGGDATGQEFEEGRSPSLGRSRLDES